MLTAHRGASAILSAIAATGKVMAAGGDSWHVSCPCKQNHANGDRRPSAKIWIEERRVRCWCAKGCKYQDWVSALGTPRAWWESPDRAEGWKPRKIGEYVMRYDYHDEEGRVVYSVRKTADKQFFQTRKVHDTIVYGLKAGWYRNVDRQGFRACREQDSGAIWFEAAELLPYRLPELLAAPMNECVVITEGEKDAESLVKLGIVATCNSGGAGKFGPEHARWLRGRCVIICPDNDPSGALHAATAAGWLVMAGVRALRIVQWQPEDMMGEKDDVSDWIARHKPAAEEMRARLREGPGVRVKAY